MSASKTAQAAEKAVARSKKTDAVERTPEQIIQGIRNNLASRMAVTPDDARVLLAEYDKLVGTLQGTEDAVAVFKAEIADLKTKNEEFRAVYESENRSMTFKAERVPAGAPDSIESGSVESVPEQVA